MADAQEMRRLMLHAAELLDAQEPAVNARVIDEQIRDDALRGRAYRRAQAEAVAMGVASAVLRMVAACMADEPGEGGGEHG